MIISIIIPVYNTEQYLVACLDSILSQSFADYEVLLIDDGSSDGSGRVCDEYARRDSRIRVFHKENGGVSSARNLGLDNARGEWVYFVDSDDEILPNGLQTMVDSISGDIDIVLAGYKRCDDAGNVLYEINDRVVTIMDKRESLSTLYEGHGKYYDFLTYGCIRLLRNTIIQTQNLRFDTGIRNKEDTLFIAQYICRSNGLTRFTTTPVYRYNQRKDSAMGKWASGFDYGFIDSLDALVKMKHEIETCYPIYSQLYFIAQEGVWIRFRRIVNKMKMLGFHDEALMNRMEGVVNKELGLGFFIKKKVRNMVRKRLKSCL